MTSSPQTFTSPFLVARPVKKTERAIPPPARPTKVLDARSIIPWREFVEAVWRLPEGYAYTGDIPESISSQDFWVRVNRAARQRRRSDREKPMGDMNHARIGIAIRGDRFWVWPEKVPPPMEGVVTKAHRGWIGELLLKLKGGEPIELDRELSKKERVQLLDRARRKGWKLYISRKAHHGKHRVQWIGER